MLFQWIIGRKPFKNVPTLALIFLDQSRPPPTTPNPFSNFFPIFIFLHISPTPATTYSDPCFLFFEPTSPKDLQIPIKHREFALKTARISNFIPPAPHWCKIKAKFSQNREFRVLHWHLIFAKKNTHPCFLFLEGISLQDLQIRIKRRELVLKAARISNFIPLAPHWWKIKAKFTKTHEISVLHCHLVFVKQNAHISH